jgi:polar amino acid transport system substrate-binding protein
MSSFRPFGRAFAAVSVVATLAGALVACGSSGGSGTSGASAVSTASAVSGVGTASSGGSAASAPVTIQIAQNTGSGGTPASIQVQEQDSIRKELPASLLSSGTLTVGVGALPQGFAPIAYFANDNTTLIGTDPDLARAIAAVLGLKVDIQNFTWDNLFVAIDSGKVDAGFSNITDTQQRKEKYDFASYREDNVGFAVKAANSWTFDRTAAKPWEQLAGLTVATDAGTNQEKILIAFQQKLKAEGKTLTIKYFPDLNTAFSAVVSGRVDAYFTPNPTVAFEATSTAGTNRAIKDAGTYSGAGASLQGLIAATSKKGDGLARPLSDAISYLLKNGQYATILKAYGDQQDAVTASSVNPPGLPLSNA